VKRIKVYFKGNTSKQVSTVVVGTAIAQIIPLVMLPVLTRIFSPDNFGDLAVAMALASFFVIFGTARLEFSLIQTKTVLEAKRLFGLSMFNLILVSLISLLLLTFFNEKVDLFKNELAYYLVPFLVLGLGMYALTQMFLNKIERYYFLSLNKVVFGALASIIPIVLYFTSGYSNLLLIGTIIGLLVASITLFFREKIHLSFLYSFKRNVALVRKYKKFPLIDVPSALVGFGASQIPILSLPIYFSTTYAGYYFLVEKTFIAPIALFANSLGVVFRKKAADSLKESGDYRRVFLKFFIFLTSVSIVLFIPFSFFAPIIFVFIFGEDWTIAGEIAQIFTPFFIMRFISSPLSFSFYISGKLSLNLHIQLLYLTFVCCTLLIGIYFDDPIIFLSMLSVSGVIFYSLQLFSSFKMSGIKV
jgi:O-antigen/teichoic acid export membrane protein